MNPTKEKLNNGCRNILICGAYGANNMGDESMLKAVILEMRAIQPQAHICVVTRAPEETKALYGVDAIFTFDFAALHREMKKADVYINGGGSLIQNITSRRSLRYYLYTIKLAKKCGCTVLMYGCGIGPLNHGYDRRLTAKILNSCVDAITLRDPESSVLLKEIGVTEPEVVLAADPVLSLSAGDATEADAFMEEAGMEKDGNYICFALRPWQGMEGKQETILKVLRTVYNELGLTPVFMPMNYSLDLDIAEKTAKNAGVPCIVLPEIKSAELAISLMARMKLAVSMRLHAALFAASAGIPGIALSYDPKVSSFMEYTGCGKTIELEDLAEDNLTDLIRTLCRTDNKSEFDESLMKVKQAESLNMLTAKRLMNLE